MMWAIGFTAFGAVLCAAAVLAFLGIAQVRLSGAAAIERDGLATGTRAPSWSLADPAGIVRTSPPVRPLQLVIFADHSLKSFPSVAEGLRELVAEGEPLDIVLLLRRRARWPSRCSQSSASGSRGADRLTRPVRGYNVRVGPFLIFVDSAGLVRASSLVNYSWQVAKLRQLAGLPVAAAQR